VLSLSLVSSCSTFVIGDLLNRSCLLKSCDRFNEGSFLLATSGDLFIDQEFTVPRDT